MSEDQTVVPIPVEQAADTTTQTTTPPATSPEVTPGQTVPEPATPEVVEKAALDAANAKIEKLQNAYRAVSSQFAQVNRLAFQQFRDAQRSNPKIDVADIVAAPATPVVAEPQPEADWLPSELNEVGIPKPGAIEARAKRQYDREVQTARRQQIDAAIVDDKATAQSQWDQFVAESGIPPEQGSEALSFAASMPFDFANIPGSHNAQARLAMHYVYTKSLEGQVAALQKQLTARGSALVSANDAALKNVGQPSGGTTPSGQVLFGKERTPMQRYGDKIAGVASTS